MIRGSIVAIATPFKEGKIDEHCLRELVKFQITNGTNGIVPCGTTGESPTLTHDEHHRVIELCIETAEGKVPIIAGTGSNSTAEAVSLTQHAAKAGATAALIVSPYYNKPTQEGLFRHFKTIADSSPIPIILYNIAGRTGVNIETPTVVRLANACKNIIGVKEASGSLEQMKSVKESCPKGFLLLSGDDALTLPVLKMGGSGVISVAANIIPQDIVRIITAFEGGKHDEAEAAFNKTLPLVKSLFLETNPIPVKTAMGMLGMCSGDVRLPLCEMSEENQKKLKQALTDYGLIKLERVS